MLGRNLILAVSAIAFLGAGPITRKWTDASGKFTVQADLVAFDESTVVLMKKGHELVSVKIEQLSKEDQEYLKSKEAELHKEGDPSQLHTWTLKNGLKVNGRVLGYGRRDVVVERKRGKLHVNDRAFEDLPDVYQRMLPKIVSHFEKQNFETEKDLLAWLTKQKGPKKYTCEGVMLELENGEEYAVPFFAFSTEDQQLLQPGWERWLAADKDVKQQQHEEFLVRAQAAAYQRDRQANKQMQQLELGLLAVASGITDLWQVQMFPPGGAGRAVLVVVPARNSGQAMVAAKNRYPNYVPGPTRRVND